MEHVSSSIFSFQIGGKDTFLDTFHYLPKNDKEKEAGELISVIEFLDNPGAEDAITHAIFQTLRDVFYSSTRKDVFDRFEDALREVNAVIEAEGNKRESGSLGRISACIGLLQGKLVHFSQTGAGSVYIHRDGKFSRISETQEPEAQGADLFVNISSGELEQGDSVVFTTLDILEDIDKSEIKDVLSADDAEKSTKAFKGLMKQARIDTVATMCLFMGSVAAQDVMDAYDEREKEAKRVTSSKKSSSSATSKAVGLVLGFTKKYLSKAKDGVSSIVRKGRKSKPQAQKKGIFGEGRRYAFIGLVAAIVLLIIVLIFRSVNSFDNARVSEYEKLLRETRSNLNIAEQRSLIGEKQDAQSFLKTAEAQVQEILATGYFRQEANQILEDIARYRDEFDAIFRVSEPFVVADIAAKGPDVEALGLVHTKDDKNFVFEYNMLYETLLEKVQDPLVIDEEEVITAGWEFEDNNSLVFTSQSGQIVEYKDGAFTKMITDDPQWNPGSEVKTYSRFIYVLDNEAGKIWKYPRLRNKYGTSSAYNLETDLSNAASFAIDGDIYVLLKTGEIKKFRKGLEQQFQFRSQPSVPVSSPTKIYTHPELVNLYVLDPENKRVVVFGKDNNGFSDYKRQFIFEGLDDMRDIYIDSNEQKLFVLTKDKIFGADI